jgi:hypothetical protein
MKDEIFQKNSIFYYSTTAEWNFWNVVVLMIYKKKKNVAKLQIQNGGLIQDGDENIFCFHIISRDLNLLIIIASDQNYNISKT